MCMASTGGHKLGCTNKTWRVHLDPIMDCLLSQPRRILRFPGHTLRSCTLTLLSTSAVSAGTLLVETNHPEKQHMRISLKAVLMLVPNTPSPCWPGPMCPLVWYDQHCVLGPWTETQTAPKARTNGWQGTYLTVSVIL